MGHISLALSGHGVQLELVRVSGHNMIFIWLPIYCAYLNYNVWLFVHPRCWVFY